MKKIFAAVFAAATFFAFSQGRFCPYDCECRPVMGQVKSVDEKQGRLVVVNADGEEVAVSVNPKTVIFNSRRQAAQTDDSDDDRPPANPAGQGRRNFPARKNRRRDFPKVEILKISDIKAGDWVNVLPFCTDTKTCEADRIEVFEKK